MNCIHNGGIAPLGYDVGPNKKYIINKKEAEAVKIIFDLYLQNIGYASIADILNSRGYKNKLGKDFRKTSIRDSLLNEKYIGIFVYGKKNIHGKNTGKEIKVEDGIPAIIEKDTFYKVQEKMKNRKIGNRATAKETYFLTGLCICGECGGAFSGGHRSVQRNKTVDYGYLCRNRKEKVNDCRNKPIRKEILEEMVFSAIREKIFATAQIENISDRIFNYITSLNKNSNKNLKIIENELKLLKTKAEKLLDYNLDGKISDEVFSKKNNEIELEIFELKRKIKEYDFNPEFLDKNKIKNHLLNLSEDFKSKDEFLIKNILETFIEKVTVYNNRVVIDMKIFSMMDMARNGGDDGNRTRVRNYQRHRLLQA